MANTVIASGTADLSDYTSRRVTIEVIGGCDREIMRLGKYTMTIPFSCLSQTIQEIHRIGGKVTGVNVPHLYPEASPKESVQPVSSIATSEVLPPPKTSTRTRQVTKPTNSTQGQRSKRKPKV
jgi:hypothetical protein